MATGHGLNPVETTEIAEMIQNLGARYNLDGQILVSVKGGHMDVVGKASPAIVSTIIQALGEKYAPMIMEMMMKRWSK